MATSADFRDFVLERLEQCACEYLNASFNFSARKMFGEYCVYIHNNDFGAGSISSKISGKKVLFLLCDEQVFIKKYEVLEQIAQDFSAYFSLGFPFDGAREHYVVDIENAELLAKIIQSALPYLPTPKSTSKAKKPTTKGMTR